MRFQPIIESFTTGEISPLLLGRVSTDQYSAGCKTMENAIPESHGGFKRRPGSVFVSEVKDSTKSTRLIPFNISRDESYILELGDLYMRFYTNHGQIQSGGSAYEITTPWGQNDLFDIHFAQANDIMYMVHDKFNPRKLTHSGSTSWALSQPTLTGTPWNGNADNHADGFPRTVAFFEQRLWLGGTISKPNTLWGSKVGDFENFTIPGTANPDDPVEYTLATYTKDTLQWLAPAEVLFIGTTANEHRLAPNSYISVDNLPDITRQSSYGSRHIQPQYIGSKTVFVQGSGLQVRTFSINTRASVEVYDSINLAWLNEHITVGGIVDMSFEMIPDSILWSVRNDGTLLSMTYDPALGDTGFEGVGWARHPMDGNVESVATIYSSAKDETWVVVKRTINSVTKRYIEYLDSAKYTDSTLSYSGSSATTIGGLTHLEGKVLNILADGAVHPQKTVASGSITLDYAATAVDAGLPFTPKVIPVEVEGGIPSGVSQGLPKRWVQCKLRLHQSALPKVNGVRPADRTPASPMDAVEPLTTGDSQHYNLGHSENGQITIEQDLPVAMHVLAVFGHMTVSAGGQA